ncbi:MAG: autotransporter-associated beta strand repeat-containing protein [Chthoniobacteraceae bacterium]
MKLALIKNRSTKKSARRNSAMKKRFLSSLFPIAALALGLSSPSPVGAVNESFTFNAAPLPLVIPDGNLVGTASVQTPGVNFTTNINYINPGGVTVTVNLAGTPLASSGFNGDIYLYLSHSVPGNPLSSGLSVLLNRPGVNGGNPIGYSDSGFTNVTFTDAAPTDAHNYQPTFIPGAGNPLVGVSLSPDARFVAPNAAPAVIAATARTNFLSVFNGESAKGGTWTLFAADASGGNVMQLNSWTLNLSGLAGQFFWRGGTDNNWSNIGILPGAPNWTADVGGNFGIAATPDALSDVIFSTTNVVPGNRTTTLGSDIGIKTLIMQDAGGAVQINGANTLTLNGGAGTGIDVQGGAKVLTIGAALNMGTSDTVTVNNFVAGGGQGAFINGNISGGNGLKKAGTGVLQLGGANTYTGATNVNAGVLVAASAGSLSGSGVTVLAGATLAISSGVTPAAIPLQIAGNGVLDPSAKPIGALFGGYFGPPSTYAGLVTLTAPARIGTNANVGVFNLTGGVNNAGNAVTFGYNFNNGATPGTIIVNSAISGSGDVIVDAQTTTFAAANSYTGSTFIIDGGTLNVNALGSLPLAPRTAVIMDQSGTLGSNLVLGANQSIASLTGAGGPPASLVNLNANTLTIGNSLGGGSTIFAGIISNTGGVTKDGTSNQIFNGTNTYTGVTNINGGVLTVGSVPGAGSIAAGSTVNVGTNGTLAGLGTINGNATLTGNGVISFTSGGNIVGTLAVTGGNWQAVPGVGTGIGTVTGAVNVTSGNFFIGNSAVLNATSGVFVSGAATFSAGNTLTTINGSLGYTSTGNSTYQGIIAGGTSAVTVNTGTSTTANALTLSGNNTYGGATNVISGLLIANSPNALGGTGTGTSVASGASVEILGVNLAAEPMILIGTGVTNGGVPQGALFGSGTASTTGPITLPNNALIGTDTVATTLTLSGGIATGGFTVTLGNLNSSTNQITVNTTPISGTGSVTVNRGVTNLAVANTYTGTTNITNGGTLNANILGALPAPGSDGGAGTARLALLMDQGGTGSSLLNVNTNQFIASLTSAASSNVNIGPGSLTIGNATLASTTHLGTFTGTGALTKDGASTQVLGAPSPTYTGPIFINTGGFLEITTSAGFTPLGSAVTGTTVNAGGALRLQPNATTGAEPLNLNGNGVGGIGGALVVQGPGTSVIGGPVTLGGAPLSTTTIVSNPGVTIIFSGGINKDNRTLVFDGRGGGNFIVNTAPISGATSFTSDMVINGGTTTFGGENTYNGPTWIGNGGTLNANALAALPLTTAEGGSLGNGVVARTVVIMDPDTLANFPGAPASIVPPTINTGSTLSLGFNQKIQSLASANSVGGKLSFVNLGNSTLTIGTAAGSTTFFGVLGGGATGGIIKDGLSTQILAGNNTYNGPTIVQGGNLQIGVGGVAGTPGNLSGASAVTVNPGAFLDLNLADTGIFANNVTNNGTVRGINLLNNTQTASGVITGTGSLLQNVEGTTILTNINTYQGGTVIGNGTNVNRPQLQVGSGVQQGSVGTGNVTFNGGGALILVNVNGNVFPNNVSNTTVGNAVFRQNEAVGVTTTITGAITSAGGGQNLHFWHTGAGTTILTNAGNIYTASQFIDNTTIQAGTLQIGTNASPSLAGANLAGRYITVTTGGTLDLVNIVGNTLNNELTNTFGGTGTVNVNSLNNNTLTGSIATFAGTIALNQIGTGSTTLTNALNAINGGVTVSNGSLIIGTAVLPSRIDAAGAAGVSVGTNGVLTLVNLVGNAMANNITNGIGGTGLVNVNSANTNTLSGILSNGGAGTLALTQSGAGTTTLTGANTYTGATLVSAGTLQIGNGALAGASIANSVTTTVNAGGTLAINLANNETFANNVTDNGAVSAISANSQFLSGVISGSGVLNKSGAGITALSGNNTYSGVTTISAGILQIGAGGATGTLGSGPVTDNATLTFLRSDVSTVANLISGTGVVGQVGGGTTILTAANTYTGNTVIQLGTLQIGNGVTLGSSIATSANTTVGAGAALAINLATGETFANAVTDNGAVNGVNTGVSVQTLSGNITGAGVLNQNGTGTTILTGANGYAGVTTINAGTLQIGAGATAGTLGGGNVIDNGALIFNRSDAVTVANAISGSGTLTKNGGGTTTLTGANTYVGVTNVNTGTLQIGNGASGNIQSGLINIAPLATLGVNLLSGQTLPGNIANSGTVLANPSVNAAQTQTIGGNISGTGVFTQNGLGTTILTGTSTYTGATTVTNGILRVNGSLGNTAVTVQTGATLGGSGSIAGAVSVQLGGHIAAGNSPGTLTVGSLNLVAGSNSDFELGVPGVIGQAALPGNDLIQVNGNLVLAGFLNVLPQANFGTGSYRLFNYTGVLTPNATTVTGVAGPLTTQVYLGVTGQVNLLVLNPAVIGAVQFWDGSGAVNDGNIAGGNGTWDGFQNNWTNGGGNPNAAWQNGVANFGAAAGTVTLGSTVNAQGLIFATSGYQINGSGAFTLNLVGGPAPVPFITVGAGLTATINAQITGSNGLTADGQGTLVLTNTSNSYTGGVTVTNGVLSISSDANLGNAANALTLNNGTLQMTANNVSTARGITLVGTGTIDVTNANTFSANGVISGAALSKSNMGTLVLGNAANNYAGPTNILNGTVSVATNGNLGQGTGGLTFGGALGSNAILQTSAAVTFGARAVTLNTGGGTIDTNGFDSSLSGVISGVAGNPLTKAGLGTLTVTGASTYLGQTNVNAGTLQVGDGAVVTTKIGNNTATVVVNNTGTLALNLANNGSFGNPVTNNAGGTVAGVNAAGVQFIDGIISGTGLLTQTGAGTTTLRSANNYTGPTTVSAGVLQVGDGTSGSINSTGLVTVNPGGKLGINLATNTTFGNTVINNGTVQGTNSGANVQTISGQITGLGNFIQGTGVPGGRTILTNNNSYTGGTTINGAGTVLQIGNAGQAGAAGTNTINVNGGSTLELQNVNSNVLSNNVATTLLGAAGTVLANSALTTTISGSLTDIGVTGPLNLTQQGAGTTILTNTGNTYVGATTVSGGVLQIGTNAQQGSFGGSSPVKIGNGAVLSIVNIVGNTVPNANITNTLGGVGTLNVNSIFNNTIASQITDGGPGTIQLTQTGSGITTLTAANTYSGTTTITAGTLQIGNGGGTGTLGTGNVIDNGALVFNRNNSMTVANLISGSGSVTQSGLGGTTILTAANSYNGPTLVTAGTLQIGNGVAALASITNSVSTTVNAGAALAINLLGGETFSNNVLDNGAVNGISAFSQTLSGNISGAGTLTQAGTGTMILTGANTYQGITTINLNGTLQIGNGSNTGSLGTGNVTDNGALIFKRNDTITVANLISGTGTLSQQGAGTTVLIAGNTYTGATTVTTGTLQIGNGSTVGASIAASLPAVAVSPGATLAINLANGETFSNGVTDNGAVNGISANTQTLSGDLTGTGTLNQLGTGTMILTGANNYSGVTTISAGILQVGAGAAVGTLGTGNVTDNGALVFNRSDVITVGNLISGTGTLRQQGAGTTILTGANTYSGATTVAFGTLQIGNGILPGASIANSVSTTVNNGAALAINLANGETFANHVLNNGSLNGVNTTPNVQTLSGNIAGIGSVNQTGTGTTILTGANTYAGATTIVAGGTIQIGNGGTVGNLGSGAVTDNGTLIFNRSNLMTVGNVINGAGAVIQQGTGTTILTATNGYTGATTVAFGTLQIGDGATPNASIAASAITVNGPGTLAINLAANETFGNNVTDNGAVNGISANTQTLSGVISGTGTLNQNGAGRTILTGNNTYAGVTTINAGILQVGNGGVSGSLGTGAVTDNAALVFNRSDAITVANLISGTGTLTQQGAGTTTLTGANTYTGVTNVNAGTLQVGDGATGNIQSGQINIVGGATFALNLANNGTLPGNIANGGTINAISANTQTFAGNISGTGVFNQTGTGLTILTGASTYTGATTVVNGNLRVNGSLGNTAVTVQNGATLSGFGSIAGNVTVLTGGNLNPGSSPGTLTTGTMVLNAGSNLNFELGVPGVIGQQVLPGNDLVNVNGNLTLDGNLNVTQLAGFGSGSYRLFNYTGTLTNNIVDNINGVGAGFTPMIITQVPNQVILLTLTNGAGPVQFWDGGGLPNDGIIAGGTGNWDGFATNWTNNVGNPNASWQNGRAIFAGTAGTVTAVAPVFAQDLFFLTDGYVINGTNGFGLNLVGPAPAPTVNVIAAATATINAQISGTNGLTSNGAGTLVLGNVGNNYTGGTTVTGGGTVSISADGNLGAVPGAPAAANITLNNGILQATATFALNNNRGITLAGAGGIDVTGANRFTVGSVITGPGSLAKTGTGILTLSGVNTYAGGTLILGGTLEISNDNNLGNVAGNVTFSNGATLKTLAGIASARAISLGAVANTGGGIIDTNGFDSTLTGVITGAAGNGLVKNGVGILTVTGASTYLGTTTINTGTLQVGDNATAGAQIGNNAANVIVANGAILDVRLTNGGTFNNTIATALGATINSSNLAGATQTFGGVISGAGVFNQNGLGTAVLNGANTYTGQTNVNFGTVVLGNATALGTIAAGTVVASGATLDLNGQTVGAEALVIGGAGVGGNGALINGNIAVAASLAGPVTLTADTTITTNSANANLTNGGSITLSGNVSGGFGIVKNGNGTLTLTGLNIYTGQTLVNAGILQAGNNFALGSVGAGTKVVAGASLQILGNVAVVGEPVEINGFGAGAAAPGALTQSLNGSSSLAGPITVATNANISTNGTGTMTLTGGITKNGTTLTLNGGGTININGVGISGATSFTSDLVIDGTGVGGLTVVNLNAASSYAGPTWITNGGTLNALVLGALPSTAADGLGGIAAIRTTVIMDPVAPIAGTPPSPSPSTGGSILNLGASQAIQSLTGASLPISSKVNLATNTLTIGTNLVSNTNFAGIISGANAAGASIIKDGTSTQVFSGNNTYTGSTTVIGGTLQAGIGTNSAVPGNAFGVNSAVTVGTAATVGTATLELAGNSNTIGSLTGTAAGIVQSTGGVATLTTGALGTSTNYAGVLLDGAGGQLLLVKNGIGTQTLSGPASNTYTGLTTVNGGELDLNKSAGFIAVGGNLTIGDGSAPGANSDIVKLLAANQILATSLVLIDGTSGRLDLNGFAQTVGSIADTGVVTANGSGINLGAGTLTTGAGGGANPANPSTTFSGAITGVGGNLTKEGTGTLTLAGAAPASNTYSGLTTVNAGQLDLNKTGGALAVGGNLTIGNGAGVGANSDVVRLLGSNQILATSLVLINGTSGRLDLNGNSQTVGSVADTGVVTPNGSSINLGSGTLTTGAGGGANPADPSTTFSGVVSGTNGNLTKAGNGIFTLSGTNTYTGATNVTGGTLRAGSTQAFGLNSAVNISNASTLDLAGNSNSIGSLAGLNGFVRSSAGPATLTTGGLGTSTAFAGVLQDNVGPLSLVKNGIGVQTLSGANTYTGTTTVNGGSLLAGSTSAFGVNSAVTVNGGATLDLGGNSNTIGSLTGFPGATVQNSTVLAATLTTGGLNTSTTFSGTIQNGMGAPLAFVKNGTGTQILSGVNSYTGGTTLNAGTLAAGSMKAFGSGNLTLNGGTLRTSGGPLIVDIGGGNVQFNAGIYLANVGGTAPGITHDQLRTTGTANTLGGTLALVQQNGYLLAPGDKVNLLVATGGVAGGSVNGTALPSGSITGLAAFSNTPLLVPTVNAYLTTVTLEATQGSFAGLGGVFGPGGQFIAFTPNQIATARALDSVARGLNFRTGILNEFNFLDMQPLSTLPGNLDKIAPEEFAAFFQNSVALANVQTANLGRRMDDIRSEASAPSASGLASAGSGPSYSGGLSGPSGKRSKEIAPPNDERWGAFLTGSGEFTRVGSTTNAAGYRFESAGVTGGLDYRVNDHFAIGLNFGYVGTTSSLVNGGKIETDGGRLGLYATYFDRNFHVDAAVTGGLNSYNTRRITPNNTAAVASPEGSEINILIAAGYDWKVGKLTVGPTASYQYTNVHTDGFTETGAFAPLAVNGQSTESSRTSFGVRASYDAQVGGVIVRPELRLSWQHEFGDTAPTVTSRFVNLGGNPFTVTGPQIGRDSLLMGAGFTILWTPRFATYLYYDGEIGRSNYDSHNISGGVRLQF